MRGKRPLILALCVLLIILQYRRAPVVEVDVEGEVVVAVIGNRMTIDPVATMEAHAARARDPVSYSIVVLNSKQSHHLEEVLDSIFQLPPASFEVIVVNEPGSAAHSRAYEEAAQNYMNKYPDRVFAVGLPPDTTEEDKKTASASSAANRVTFLSSPNALRPASRNFGIDVSAGKWLLNLDAGSKIDPNYFREVELFLQEQGETIDNTKLHAIHSNVQEGDKIFSPPTFMGTNARIQESLHLSALYRRELFETYRYRHAIFFGQEDWDFWLRVWVNSPDIQVGYIYKVLIHVFDNSRGRFCLERPLFCRALLYTANAMYYSPSTLTFAMHSLLASIGDIPELPVLARGMDMNSEAPRLWMAFWSYEREPEQARAHCEHIKAHTDFDKYYKLAGDLIQMLDGTAPTTTRAMIPILAQQPMTNATEANWEVAQTCHLLNNELLNLPAGTAVFHQLITRMPESPGRELLTRFSTASILKYNPQAILVLHVSSLKFSRSMEEWFIGTKYRIKIVPLCTEYLATASNAELALARIVYNRDSPFYYSHVTDFFRYAVLFQYGGTYMDTDIVLTASTSGLKNTVAFEKEEHNDEVFVNGAFLTMQRQSQFLADALDWVLDAYSPDCWNCIGPKLLTGLVNRFWNNGNSPFQHAVAALMPERFNMFGWQQVRNFTADVVTDEAWSHIRKQAYGFHFWGRVLFGEMPDVEKPPFVPFSVADRVLRAACPRDIQCPQIPYSAGNIGGFGY